VRISLVLGVIGQLLRLFSVAFVPPILLALWDGDWMAAIGFAGTLVAAMVVGSLLARLFAPVSVFRRSEALAVVSGTWLLVGHFGAVPYMLHGLHPVDALFESISGFTTTGATILTDFDGYNRSFFLWRAMTQWFGGLGVIALFVVVLPRLGIAGRQLFFAEASGALGESLAPQIRQTARRLWILYAGLTGGQAALLIVVADMPAYEAILHSFTTLAAGGFSANAASIAGYANPTAEWIIVVFMMLAGTSFTLQWKAISGRPLAFFRDGEFLFYLGTALVGALGVSWMLAGGLPSLENLRHGAFQSASLVSSTGFASVDYNLWGDGARVFLVLVMVIGGCAGSAAGGAKAIRYLLVLKFLWREVTRVLHPRAVLPIRYGRREVPEEVMRAVFTLVALYLAGYLFVALLLVILGADFVTGCSASLACLGNIGPGFGLVGPMANFAGFPVASKVLLTLAMWVGRLEIVAVLALLHPDVWRHTHWRGQ